MKEPRTLLTVFALAFGATILLVGVWAQSATSAGVAGKKGGKKVPHDVSLSGDLVGSFTADLNPNDPLAKAGSDDFILTFPAGDTLGADGCGVGTPNDPFVCCWGGYAENSPWTGTLDIQRTKQGGSVKWHVSFNEATNVNGKGSINLVIQSKPTETKSGDTTTLEFTNARGLVGALSSPDGTTTDGDNRCLTFSISATPQ